MKRFTILTTMAAAALLAFALPVLAASAPGDDTIRSWVQEALRNDPRVTTPIDVSTLDGIVTLQATLPNLAERRYAVLETQKISGVRGVIDKMQIEPEIRSDADIRSDIADRLADSPLQDIRGLRVTVADGMATLRGTVPSWSEKQQAGLLAGEVLGVRQVFNDTEIVYGDPRTSDQIRQDVRAAIDRDVYLVGLPVNVEVADGNVTLTGSVGSAFAKERATQAAWVDGVDRVHNELSVVWWKDNGARRKYAMPSDDQIAESVRSELFEDLRITAPYDIGVTSEQGHVSLSGSVPTYYQKRLAAQNAKDVVGVGWVTNYLQVKTNPRSDETIRSEILKRFDSDFLTNGQDLQVRVQDGVVSVTGNTNTFDERSHAIDLAGTVPGVTSIYDGVQVNRVFQYTDATLQQHIADRLESHDATRQAAPQVEVKVDQGIATLTGNVRDWSERKEAGKVAFLTDGIRGVRNELTVDGYSYPWDEWRSPKPELRYYDYFYEMYPTLL